MERLANLVDSLADRLLEDYAIAKQIVGVAKILCKKNRPRLARTI